MHNLFILTLLTFLFASISTTAFEDTKNKSNINFVYKLNTILDDLVLNYCTTYDSYTVNRLYSQKRIKDVDDNTKVFKRYFISLKKKPLNRSLFKIIDKKSNSVFSNKNINEVDLSHLSNSKKEFVKTLLPLISHENQNILLERTKLKAIKISLDTNKTLAKRDLIFLEKISKKYRLKINAKLKYQIVNELLDSVDIIPSSIVLAQAANESGWGTSRFAREFNALFGEYTYDFSKGVVPLLREEGEKYLVKSFDSINRSVQSYFNNLNSHYAYSDFREVRRIMREQNNFNNIKLLVNQLDSYAEDENYIKTINAIIDKNKLNEFDDHTYSFSNS